MRIRTLAVLTAAAVFAAGPAAAQEPRGIVFVLWHNSGQTALLVPVAVLGEGRYEPPASGAVGDGSMNEFASRWLDAGHRYDVLRRGERLGAATVVQRVRAPCGNPDAEASLALETPPPTQWHGIAGAGLPEQRGAPWVRESSAEERQVLDRLSAAIFAAHGVGPVPRRTSTVTTAAVLFGGITRPVLVGTYTLTVGYPLPRQASAFIVAEEGENGYRPVFTDFHEGLAPDHRRLSLIDAADLDGDGLPELVLENQYWEWANYSILSRGGEHGWVTAHRGGRSGC